MPEFGFGAGPRQTFQIRLYPNGRIEFCLLRRQHARRDGRHRAGRTARIELSLSSFSRQLAGVHRAVAERFGGTEEIDLATAAQKFYETHDDSYDYLVIYNNMGIAAAPGAVAYEARCATIAPAMAIRASKSAASSARPPGCRLC